MDVFLLDGHAHKALMFAYLPLFLTNARANHDVGLLAGLKFLVEIYEKLLRHKCLMLSGPTVRVDMSSLAMVMKDVEDVPTLRPSDVGSGGELRFSVRTWRPSQWLL